MACNQPTDKVPTVSIGLPVFNGERYIREAIESILMQTFTDFELIISDNASTDRTEEICREYAAKDDRIRYYRNATNIGGANNGNQTFRLSRGQYFRWAAHDDVLAPNLLERCVEVLEQDPAIVLVYPLTVEIDDNGQQTGMKAFGRGTSYNAFRRFKSLALKNHACEAIYGLLRSDVLRKTRLLLNYIGADRTLLCELSLYGRFDEIHEPLFYKRYHAKNIYVDGLSRHARAVWFNPTSIGKVTFPPYWQQFLDFWVTIGRVNFSIVDKVRCYLFMFVWLYFHKGRLLNDLQTLLYLLLKSPGKRKQLHEQNMNWL